MNEFMQLGQGIGELTAALSKAQSELTGISKGGTGNFGKYSRLEDVIPVVRPVLAKHGLAIMQFPCGGTKEGGIGLTTILSHASGQWVSGTAYYYSQKPGPQGSGSCITYARRYGILAALNLECEDDDGHAASNPDQGQQSAPRADLGSFDPPSGSSTGSYVVPFGKFKGKTLNEIPKEDIESYVKFLSNPKDGKPPTGSGLTFISEARRFLQQKPSNQLVKGPASGDAPDFADADFPF